MQIKLNIQKKHFWIITSLIVMMIGALVLAADPISKIKMNSPDKFGHNTDDLNFKITREIVEFADIPENAKNGKSLENYDVKCSEGQLAIGCSVWNPTEEGDEDAWFCKLHQDQSACRFTYDTSSSEDNNEKVELHCNCIKGQK